MCDGSILADTEARNLLRTLKVNINWLFVNYTTFFRKKDGNYFLIKFNCYFYPK